MGISADGAFNTAIEKGVTNSWVACLVADTTTSASLLLSDAGLADAAAAAITQMADKQAFVIRGGFLWKAGVDG
jgi:hypothetical protein